jgi:DNA-binding transcriptional LysR family regulator
MIDDLLDLRIFARVVASGSLSSAARDLDLSLAVVSKRLASLEQRLGVRLMNRTTRSQSLTFEGQAFHERCTRILAEVEDAEAFISGSRQVVSGQLAITAPRTFGRQYVVPLVARFQAEHPDLSVRLMLSDDIVDMIESGIDVAFRFGELLDSGMSARPVAPNYRVLCAAPAYIARRGEPRSPGDLMDHACIVYGARPAAHWLFTDKGQHIAAKVRGSFMTNDGDSAQALALEGAGILFKSIWDVAEHLASGRLVRVMSAYSAPTEPLNIVMPHVRSAAPRVRRFVDHALHQLLREHHWGALDAQTMGGVQPESELAPV